MRALGILHITSTVLILSILEQLATNAFKLQLAINNRRPLAAKCTSVDQDFSSEELKNLQVIYMYIKLIMVNKMKLYVT